MFTWKLFAKTKDEKLFILRVLRFTYKKKIKDLPKGNVGNVVLTSTLLLHV